MNGILKSIKQMCDDGDDHLKKLASRDRLSSLEKERAKYRPIIFKAMGLYEYYLMFARIDYISYDKKKLKDDSKQYKDDLGTIYWDTLLNPDWLVAVTFCEISQSNLKSMQNYNLAFFVTSFFSVLLSVFSTLSSMYLK